MMRVITVFLAIVIMSGLVPKTAESQDVDILLTTTPEIPLVLLNYVDWLRDVYGAPQPLVGINKEDIGEGPGDGYDDLVAIPFAFPPFSSVSSATLTLNLTIPSGVWPNNIATEELLFQDDMSHPSEGYGNEYMYNLSAGNTYEIAFDLSSIPGKAGTGNTFDIRDFLLDGSLNLIYSDDAVINSARLQISGTQLPCFGLKNHNGKWALHFAGVHDSKVNTCDLVMADCGSEMVTSTAETPGRFDIYVLALDVRALAASRFGLACEVALGGGFSFYGWTNCADLEIPTAGWPGCGEGNALSWTSEQAGPHVTMGILDVYVYPGTNAKLCADVDPRVGFAEFCDGSEPAPCCNWVTNSHAFGCVGFGRLGYNPCSAVPVQTTTWGALKAQYR